MSSERILLGGSEFVPVHRLGDRPGRLTELVRDERSGRPYVVRTLVADLPPLERARALREAEPLAGVRVTWESDQLSVARPWVQGEPLSARLRADGPVPAAEALRLVADLLDQLAAVHARGRVHGALQPDAIVLGEAGALILDLEFLAAPTLWRVLRTPAEASMDYLAPEQVGLIDRAVDARADLYSLGIVLFESLTGERPFAGTDVRDLLHQHLSAPVPSVRDIDPRVPRSLDQFVARLLRKDPDDRPRDAAEAHSEVRRLYGALASPAGVDAEEQDDRSLRPLAKAEMAGRSAQLSALLRRTEDARHGVASCALIAGVSGGGKSRLLEEFAARAADRGASVLRGGGVEGAAQHPLQVLVGVVEDIVTEAREDHELRARLRTLLASSGAALRDVLPALSDVLPPVEAGGHIGGTPGRQQAVSAITALLTALGTIERPAVVLLDDCQWADEFTIQVLTSLARAAQNGELDACLALVVAMRPEDVSDDHPLLTAPGFVRLDLPPLGPAEVAEVVRSMAGDVPAPVLQVVGELSQGEPLMISAVLRGLVESGALSATSSGWTFTPPAGGWEASPESADILSRRISLLDATTRAVLQGGAVYGRTFDLAGVAEVTALGRDAVARALTQAEERSLVRRAGAGHFTIVHDRLRASLLADVEPAELPVLHLGVAEQIEREDSSRAFELAHHFDVAGRPGRALPYALRAAAVARSQHDLELAEHNYRIAERGMAGSPASTSFEVSEALGEILMLRGRYDEAAEQLERARALAETDMDIAQLEGRLGELVFRRDDLEGAAAHLETALVILGERIPHGRFRVGAGLVREVLRRLLFGGLRRGARAKKAPSERDLVRAHLYSQLQYPRWFHVRRLEALWLMVRQVNVAERCPGTAQLAHAYGIWGGSLALTVPFLWKRGLQYTEASEAISAALRDQRGQGHAKSMRTCVLHAAGRYEEAQVAAAEAIRVLGEYGDRWETSFAARNRAMCLYRLGRTQEALEEAGRVHRLGTELRDANAEVTALEILAKATNGRVRTAQTKRALRRQGADIEVRIAGLQADALRLRHDGDLAGAVSRLEHASHVIRHAKPTNTYLVPALPWLATVRREEAERVLLPLARRRALWTVRRDARRALRYARVFRNDRPHALRERALVCALLGNTPRARRLLQRSVDAAAERSAWGEVASTRAEGERLGLQLVLPVEAERRGLPELQQADAAEVGLADRFDALLESAVRLAAADSEGEIVEALCEATVSLLRADSCRVEWLPSNSQQTDPNLPAAVARLTELGRPVVVAPPTELTPPELSALVPDRARSAIAAPLVARDQTVGWFLAGHDQVGRMFGPDEEHLAELLARLAGAALDRSRLDAESRACIIAAQEAERSRVARDLHDEIGQALTSVLLGVRILGGATQEAEVHARAEELRGTVAGAIESVQRLAFALRPVVLDDLGLVAALRRLTEQAQDIAVELETVDIDPAHRFAPDIETTAYRIVQESLTNVFRHSGATRASVVAGRTEHRLRVVIEDDGCGFEPATADKRLGLRGMRERAELVGGTLRIDARPGRGTSIVFEVPL